MGRGDDDEAKDDDSKDDDSKETDVSKGGDGPEGEDTKDVGSTPPPVTPIEPAAPAAESATSPETGEGATNVNRATFEDLRELGFSVTQATRVITYRERQNGFDTLDDLASVPGMPRSLMDELEGRLRVS